MARLKVVVLRGGPSSEYDVSLKTGGEILRYMPENYEKHDVFISRDGIWHVGGIERSPERILRNIDVVFNALHGRFGEDGKVQRLFEQFGVPYTGSEPLPSAVGMNKLLAKQIFEKQGIRVPRHIILRKEHISKNSLFDIFRSFAHPSVIKPIDSGSSIGITAVNSFSDLERGVEVGFSYSPTLLLEEYIRGKEVIVGIIENFRNEPLYALTPVYVKKPNAYSVFDYESRFRPDAYETPTRSLSEKEKTDVQEIARLAHSALGLRHYSRSDIIVTPRGPVLLEVDALPSLTSDCAFPQALVAVGSSMPQFIDHIVHVALQK